MNEIPEPGQSAGPPWAAHLARGTGADVDLVEDRSLPGRWIHRWRERPAWPQPRTLEDGWISSEELEERTRLAARGLRAAGLQPGNRFVISGATSTQLVIAYIGALRAGLVVVPMNTAYTRTEVERIVGDAKPAGAAVEDDQRAGWIREAAGAGMSLVCGVDLAGLQRPASFDDAELDGTGSDDGALLIYTSGTTGEPKGALLSHGNLLSSATAVNLAWRWEPDDRLLLTLPLFHVHGLGVGLNGSLCAGAAVVLRPKFDVDDVAERAAESSLFFGVPAMYGRIASSGKASALRSLRLLVSGSAPLPAALSEEVAGAAGQVPLERYGMTETVMLTSNPYDGERKAGTVGFELPGVELRLADDDEVQVRGPNVISGYYERPDANAQSFTDDGWFRTGDLGELDDDGYLTLVGRSKELIITGGYNVHPREVEEALATHPGVSEVAVVGRASEEWGEEVTAVVVADGPVEVEELREHAAQQLVSYKVPKRIEFADELPRNAMGKIVRSEL